MAHRSNMINYRASDKEKENLMKLQVHMGLNLSDTLRKVVNLGVGIYEDENIKKLMKKTSIPNPEILIRKLVLKELLKDD